MSAEDIEYMDDYKEFPTKESALDWLDNYLNLDERNNLIRALEQEPRKGEWLRMSDLSEQEDDRYQCSRCRNVVHHKSKMDLYTFNSWCGRCGSDNGIKIEVEE